MSAIDPENLKRPRMSCDIAAAILDHAIDTRNFKKFVQETYIDDPVDDVNPEECKELLENLEAIRSRGCKALALGTKATAIIEAMIQEQNGLADAHKSAIHPRDRSFENTVRNMSSQWTGIPRGPDSDETKDAQHSDDYYWYKNAANTLQTKIIPLFTELFEALAREKGPQHPGPG